MATKHQTEEKALREKLKTDLAYEIDLDLNYKVTELSISLINLVLWKMK